MDVDELIYNRLMTAFEKMCQIGCKADDTNNYDQARWAYAAIREALTVLADRLCRDDLLLKIARFHEKCGNEAEAGHTLEPIIKSCALPSSPTSPEILGLFASTLEKTTGSNSNRSSYLKPPSFPEISYPPFHQAACYRNPHLQQLFVPDSRETMPAHDLLGRHAMHVAAEGGNIGLVKYLVNLGLSLEVRDKFGRTPIFHAVLKGHEDLILFLLGRNAKTNVRNINGHSLMQIAAQGGKIRIVEALLEHGCSVNDKSADTFSSKGFLPPLHAAALYGHLEVVKFLVHNGADKSQIEFRYGKTPVALARDRGHHTVVDFLSPHPCTDIVMSSFG